MDFVYLDSEFKSCYQRHGRIGKVKLTARDLKNSYIRMHFFTITGTFLVFSEQEQLAEEYGFAL